MYHLYPRQPGNVPENRSFVDLQLRESAQGENIDLWRTLLRQEATINRNKMSGNVTGILRCQKEGRPGQLFGFTNTSKWNSEASLPLYFGAHALCINRAWYKSIHTDAIRSQVERHCPGQGLDAAFSSIIGTHTTMSVRGTSAGHNDD